MKPTAFILSLIILLLSLTPCSDGFNEADEHKDALSANHDHQQDADDSCPITCVCNCCGVSIIYQPIVQYSLNTRHEIPTLASSRYQSNYRFDFNNSIWQPPQIIS
ncbi:DUF6660 family protein [Patiriisocius sp. Uisw_017]|jgi:hypothetical protein|uniref:DUF6660 family protein n=1 Tax=Patiriisocius sp. Uisw_017 TaxID=3230968 RepID=UPI0039EBA414